MADLALTAAQIALTKPLDSETFEMVAAEAITKGAACYIDSNGKAGLADASSGSGKDDVVGVALNAAAAGESVTLVKRGFVYGYTLTSQAYGDLIYLSNTNTGILADAAGDTSKIVGKVMALPESGNIQKILYVDVVFDA